MPSVHVISDLHLNFNEFTPETELKIPNVDLVVVNGNIGINDKRSMLYLEQICSQYKDTQFVYNLGFSELYYTGRVPKSSETNSAMSLIRADLNEDFPKNLTFLYRQYKILTLRNGEQVDVFCAFGFPQVHSFKGRWEDHIWYKNIIAYSTEDIDHPEAFTPKETSRASHGDLPIWASQKWINEQNQIEYKLVRDWELNVRKAKKVLVTHINPVQDTRCKNQLCSFYDIHLHEGLWVGSNTKIENTMYLGARFVSNPGRGPEARSMIVQI